MDIGESLVGAYLRHVRGCSVVVYNSFLTDQQGEVDVVGIEPSSPAAGDSSEGRTVWLCEVTTHVRGLNGSTRRRAPEKLRRLREFAQLTFPGDVHRFEWWSPYVTPTAEMVMRSARDAAHAATGIKMDYVFNAEYAERVDALMRRAATDYSPTSEPAYRMLQILANLKRQPTSGP